MNIDATTSRVFLYFAGFFQWYMKSFAFCWYIIYFTHISGVTSKIRHNDKRSQLLHRKDRVTQTNSDTVQYPLPMKLYIAHTFQVLNIYMTYMSNIFFIKKMPLVFRLILCCRLIWHLIKYFRIASEICFHFILYWWNLFIICYFCSVNFVKVKLKTCCYI